MADDENKTHAETKVYLFIFLLIVKRNGMTGIHG